MEAKSSLLLAILPLAILVSGCIQTGPELLVIDNSFDPETPQDPYSIQSLSLEGGILNISVSYSGGCVEHEWGLIGTDRFAESNPVQARVVLTHDDKDDNCDGIANRALAFDLSPLRKAFRESYGQETGVIRVLVKGTGTVLYNF